MSLLFFMIYFKMHKISTLEYNRHYCRAYQILNKPKTPPKTIMSCLIIKFDFFKIILPQIFYLNWQHN